MDNFRKVSQDSVVSLHLYGGYGWKVQSCVAAAIFRVDAAVRTGLTKPSCTSPVNEWLPCRKDIEATKIKSLTFDWEDFAQRGKKKSHLVVSPTKKLNPLAKSDKKPLSLIDFISPFEEIKHYTFYCCS